MSAVEVMTAARTLVAAPQALYRTAIRAALDDVSDLTVVGEAADGRSAVDAASALDPDLVLLDAQLRDGSGGVVCAEVKTACGARVVVIGGRNDPEQLLAAVEAGADGYVTREMRLERLVAALRQVLDGQAVVPAQMLGALLRSLIERNREADRIRELAVRLTRREREVLELLAEGCGHEAIADILVISPQTARTHIQSVITKLGVHSRLEATALAVRHGLVRHRLQKGA